MVYTEIIVFFKPLCRGTNVIVSHARRLFNSISIPITLPGSTVLVNKTTFC